MAELFDKKLIEIEVKKVEKKKRVLSQKQLDNLAKGREKMKEKRDLLRIENEKKGLLKKEKVAVKENKTIKKNNKTTKKNNKKLQEEALEHRNKLIQNKIKNEQAKKLSKFDDMRSKWLLQTETIEDYELVENELETIPEEDILNDEKLEETLLTILNKYKGDDYK